jgi:hypothetical protein
MMRRATATVQSCWTVDASGAQRCSVVLDDAEGRRALLRVPALLAPGATVSIRQPAHDAAVEWFLAPQAVPEPQG